MFTALTACLKTTHACRVALAFIALAGMLVPATAARANWLYTPLGGASLAKDFVSKHYANTYTYNLSAHCRAQGMPTRPGYKYHRLVCDWYDGSDNTTGRVLIVGSDSAPGAYYGTVIRGAHQAS
jgi:hypothetical protein